MRPPRSTPSRPAGHDAAGTADPRQAAHATGGGGRRHPVLRPADRRLPAVLVGGAENSLEHGTWLATGLDRVVLAINLIPFAGIAFLWFIGVVRDRLAEAEDRLFATVLLGSGLLFLVLMFVATAVFGAIVLVHVAHPEALRDSPAFALARAFAYTLVNVYAIRMAGVFMLITSTIALRTAFIARWMAAPGFAIGTLPAVRQPVDRLELHRLSDMGPADQPLPADHQLEDRCCGMTRRASGRAGEAVAVCVHERSAAEASLDVKEAMARAAVAPVRQAASPSRPAVNRAWHRKTAPPSPSARSRTRSACRNRQKNPATASPPVQPVAP